MDPTWIAAWSCALAGLLLGGVASLIPGFPGCAVALLGLVAFAGLTDFLVVGPEALALATLLTVAGTAGQIAAPVAAGRALGGSAGAATGAALGTILGAFVPLPGVGWILAILGAATLGLVASRRALWAWARGVLGTTGGCAVAMMADATAVLGVGAVLAIADFVHTVAAP